MNSRFFQTSKELGSLALIMAAFILSDACYSDETPYTGKLLESYGVLNNYCDSAVVIEEFSPHQRVEYAFDRCFQNDGSYKTSRITKTRWKNTLIKWSDGDYKYQFNGRLKIGKDRQPIEGELEKTGYTENPIGASSRNNSVVLPHYVFHLFIGVNSAENNIRKLDKFQINAELSTDEFAVLDSKGKNTVTGTDEIDRLWVSVPDNMIRKVEWYRHSRRVRLAEVSNIRKNSVLNAQDLSHYSQKRKKVPAPLAQADFHRDRGYKRSNIPLEPKIVRLYVGKENTNRCSGNTIERCIEWLGEPSKVETTSGTEKQYIFYGTKQLYWGSGSKNKPIGLERREMTVVDGRVEREFSTVQLIDRGYSWIPSKPIIAFGSRQNICERYGKSGTSLCYGITPIESLPPAQETPRILENYSVQELQLFYRKLVTLDACSVLSKENHLMMSALHERWNISKPGLVDGLKNTQEYPADVAQMKDGITSGSLKQKQDANFIFCESVLTQVRAEMNGK